MGAPRLGRLILRWCDKCNVPILDVKQCGTCGEPTRWMDVTPPGDIRPAFGHDLELARRLIDEQFGKGCGKLALPRQVAVLNKAPYIDRMDEVIADGEVLGNVQYDPLSGWRLIPRMGLAHRIAKAATKGFIIVDDGAIPYISKGASPMAVGIMEASPDIAVDSEILILDKDRNAIACGKAKMTAAEMLKSERGAGAKTRWSSAKYGEARPTEGIPDPAWDDVVACNLPHLKNKEEKAMGFIRKAIAKHNRPPAVAFSGGKDSLAVLLLVLEAGFKPPIMFTDTGLEFPETVAHVKDTAKRYEVELLEANPARDFFSDLERFGPPAKDFRWCCKTLKLGPTARLITEAFPDGVLSFIGQRRYESAQRAGKGDVWENPWVPGQIGASPIQNWTALHVWLYIFLKKAPYNVWYERGLDRLGCMLCPAADIAEFAAIDESSDVLASWKEFLEGYRKRKGFSSDWLEKCLWRWKKHPGDVKRWLDEGVLTLWEDGDGTGEEGQGDSGMKELKFFISSGYSPCTSGVSVEGAFDSKLDMERVVNFMNSFAKPEYDPATGLCDVGTVQVFSEGAITARGADEKEVQSRIKSAADVVRRAVLCVGCGVCLGRCPEGALELRNNLIWILSDKCAHCGKCMDGPCAATAFSN